jgi:hypothetical protein
LIPLRKIGVEIVFSCELAVRSNGAVGGQGHFHSKFYDFPIKNGQYARHAETHGAGMTIGAGPKLGGAAAKNLAPGQKLCMYFQAYDGFKLHFQLSFLCSNRLPRYRWFVKRTIALGTPLCKEQRLGALDKIFQRAFDIVRNFI